jgi:pyrroline-5-carboxylate reductase
LIAVIIGVVTLGIMIVGFVFNVILMRRRVTPSGVEKGEKVINKSMGFIGGGRIVQIILGGFQKAGRLPGHIVVSDPLAEVLSRLKENFPQIIAAPHDNRTPALQELVFIAVHPPVMNAVLSEIKPHLQPGSMVISLVPKFTLSQISAALGGFPRIMRTIPNAPSLVNAGYNPVAFAPGLSGTEKAGLLAIFSLLGNCPQVKEEHLEAYAILTAMGPTYFWFQWYELERLGESFGLARAEVRDGIAAMVMGAVKTMHESGLTADEVMDLIPVKPLGEDEDSIKKIYRSKLETLFKKLQA